MFSLGIKAMDPKLVLLLLLVCQLCIMVNGDDYNFNDVFSSCMDTSLNYTKESHFEDNLSLIFKKLTSKIFLKFYNYSLGVGINQVYGLFQCRYDVNIDVCNACVGNATQTILQDCRPYREAIVWHEHCMLRYANRNIFSLNETLPYVYWYTLTNATNAVDFDLIFEDTMNGVIKTASSSPSKFASSSTNWSSTEQLFSFAQCTPDISRSGCFDCLKNALFIMVHNCTSSRLVRVYFPSCLLWYNTNDFVLDDLITSSSAPRLAKDQESRTSQTMPKSTTSPSSKSKTIAIVAAACAAAGLLVVSVVLCICLCRKKPKDVMSNDVPTPPSTALHHDYEGLGDAEFEQYDFVKLKAATGDFSTENTLGRGGFGFVYKGTLENGAQLAIKRLSSTSGQGTKEFMSEARLLAKLQHTNLVKLVGFCLEGEEKLLVYEFMSNSSLDKYLFDPVKRRLLDWITRFKIILGIAKGLRYLHEDSRLTIVHRDLKPDNILLDEEMNPKIADFGLAKRTGVLEKRGSTNHIIGTQGYMAPECFMGEFSDKSDVYSFGVMLLEIVSGENNMTVYQLTNKVDLPTHAWRLWKEGKPFEFIDPQLVHDNCSREEVMRCIQIGLLCLQADEEKRPKMSSIVYMLMGLGDISLPSALEMSSRRLSVPNNYNGGQQSDTDHSSTKSPTMTIDSTQDLYPNPR